MEITNNVQNSNVWAELMKLFGDMSIGQKNPSNVVGSNMDPVDQILQELSSSDPDWGAVTADLNRIQDDLLQMLQVAEESDLQPASAPSFISELKSALATVESLKSQEGTPEFSQTLDSLRVMLSDIKHDILQGS